MLDFLESPLRLCWIENTAMHCHWVYKLRKSEWNVVCILYWLHCLITGCAVDDTCMG